MTLIRTDRLWDLSQPIYHDGPAWAEYDPPNHPWPRVSNPAAPSRSSSWAPSINTASSLVLAFAGAASG